MSILATQSSEARDLNRRLALLVLGGWSLLLVQYLWRQSYWGDEVAILNNIAHRGFFQFLYGGLDHSQAAPPVFLILQKLMRFVFGSQEYSQRLIPLLMAAGAMAAMAGLARSALPPGPAMLSVVLLCASDKFIWHATEVKQYAGDCFCAVLLQWMALDHLVHEAKPRRFLLWAVLAAGGLWLSHTVILVYAAISLTVGRRMYRGGLLKQYVAGNLMVLASFAALWWFSIRHQRQDAYLENFWSGSFADWSHPWSVPVWLASHLWGACGYLLEPAAVAEVVFCALVVVGAVAWARQRRWEMLGVCMGPLGLVALAALAGQYPLAGARVDLFLAPGLLLTAGAGWQAIRMMGRPTGSWSAGIVVILLLAQVLAIDARNLFIPRSRMNLRSVLAELRLRRIGEEAELRLRHDMSEAIYIGSLGDVFRWYWPDAPPFIVEAVPVNPGGSRYFWYVAAGKPENFWRQEDANLAAIENHATEIVADRIVARGGAAFYFRENRPLQGDANNPQPKPQMN